MTLNGMLLRHRCLTACMLCLGICGILFFSGGATAQTTQQKSFKELGQPKNISLTEYRPVFNLYIPIMASKALEKVRLNLQMSFSPDIGEKSYFEIKVNQKLIKRIFMPANINKPLDVSVELPISSLAKESQELSFQAFFHGGAEPCDPKNWIHIHSDSTVSVDLKPAIFSGGLQNFSKLFLQARGLITPPLNLALPPGAQDETINSMLQLSYFLGLLSHEQNIQLNAGYIRPQTKLSEQANVIVLGTRAELQDIYEGINLPGHLAVDVRNAGLIFLSASPLDSQYGMLLLSGQNGDDLAKAVQVFSSETAVKLLAGDKVKVKKKLPVRHVAQNKKWQQSTFRDNGHSNVTVSGLGHHEVSYNVHWPLNRIPGKAELITYMTVPTQLFGNATRVTMAVNGLKQESYEINKNNVAWPVAVHENTLKPGTNTITYMIDLHSEIKTCSLDWYYQSWATLYEQSKINVTFLPGFPKATLSQLPVPFSGELYVIIPDELSEQDIQNLARLYFKLGQMFHYQPVNIRTLRSSKVSERTIRSNNLLLYGTSDKNAWVAFANEYFPISLNHNLRTLILSDKQLQIDVEQSTGLMALIPSPWVTQKAVLMMSGDDAKGLNQVIDLILSDKKRQSLDGNVALVNADDSLVVIQSRQLQYQGVWKKVSKSLKNQVSNLQYFIRFHPQILIYFLVFLIPLIILYRRRKK